MSQIDEVSEVVEVVSGSQKAEYLKRQQDSFNAVGGGPKGWRPAELLEIEYRYSQGDTLRRGKPLVVYHFDIPPGYTEVCGYFLVYEAEARAHNTDPKNKDHQIAVHEQVGPRRSSHVCQLCGWAPLAHEWPILNDERRTYMNVGSECVNNFMGAGYLTKKVTLFKDNALRQAFKGWTEQALTEVETHGDSTHWLPRSYWLFKRKLEKLDPAKMTSRRIANLFKDAFELGITVPGSVLPMLGLPQALEAQKKVEAPKPQSKLGPAPEGMHWSWSNGKTTAVPNTPKSLPPAPVPSPIKQRTRWDSGKVYVFHDGNWFEAHKENGLWVPNTEATPIPDQSADPASITVGVYKTPDGTIYVVKPTRDGSHNYAKKLKQIDGERLNANQDTVPFDFEYAPGAMSLLRPEYRMGAEEAKALSIQYGHCLACGRRLKDAKSVERGIGPVCIKLFKGGFLTPEESGDVQ